MSQSRVSALRRAQGRASGRFGLEAAVRPRVLSIACRRVLNRAPSGRNRVDRPAFRRARSGARGPARPRYGVVRSDEVAIRVLVVDDDPAITRLVRRALGPRVDVVECQDARDVLVAIERGARYDVILCDLRMPGLSGEAFRNGVSRISSELAERIVFMSGATAMVPGAEFLHDVPANRLLVKPFPIDELRRVIDDLVRVSGRWKTG
jgi:CheY-like chemotaxis protein